MYAMTVDVERERGCAVAPPELQNQAKLLSLRLLLHALCVKDGNGNYNGNCEFICIRIYHFQAKELKTFMETRLVPSPDQIPPHLIR